MVESEQQQKAAQPEAEATQQQNSTPETQKPKVQLELTSRRNASPAAAAEE